MGVKEEKKNIQAYAIGIDIATDYSQISYIAKDMSEPQSISTIPGETKYLIPTLMYKIKNSDDWYIGDKAKLKSYEDNDESYTVRNLLDRIYTGEELSIDGMVYTGTRLLAIYIEKLFDEARYLENVEKSLYITVTVEKNDKVIIDAIYEALKELGYERECIGVLSHTESFVYYAINQKKELWTNDVALFDFNSDHFSYRKMTISRNSVAPTINIIESDYSNYIDMSYLETEAGKRSADEKFTKIIDNEFYKQIISTVYLTGVGFYADFADNSLVELCSKRRVFKGYNLFVKGACYDALERYSGKNQCEFIIQCEGRTKANIGLVINDGEKDATIALSNAGSSWYEAGARAECILDGAKSIELVVASSDGRVVRHIQVDLSEFPDRPNKTTRVGISMSYRDNNNTFDVAVKDLGFGDIFKATNMLIRDTFWVDEILGV